ncbi:MAG TPA: TetR/AcrR family transcriptional regulator [Thermoleophilaceae bacterium]|nr:TetR/AcrR family transcriptional regulator [Thermoleophilaceae bacterium]
MASRKSGRSGSGGTPPRRPARRRPDQIPGGRHGLAPEEVAESQRSRILAAMTDAVGRDGYQTARVADVIAHAGVSRKTFYEHFEDKEHCFIAAYQQALARLLSVTLEAFEAQDEWVDQLRAGLTALLNALAYEPTVARVCFVEVLAAGPNAVATRNEAMRGFAYIYDSGRLESDGDLPGFTGISMVGGLSEILYREITAGATAELPQLIPELMYMSVLPFVGADAAARELERGRRRHQGSQS